jgi:5'-nucleotidase
VYINPVSNLNKKCSYSVLSLLLSVSLAHGSPTETNIKILGINDFHGQISSGRTSENEPVGSAAILSAYIQQAQIAYENKTIIAFIGDQIGASGPSSGLLHDEPTILFINALGNIHCSTFFRFNPECNLVATIGNHEFDRGQQALYELLNGSNKPPTDHWIPLTNYPGSAYANISANIIDAKTKQPLFTPYVIKQVDGVPIAFVGAILRNASDMMFPANAEGIEFTDEAQAINRYIPEIKSLGAKSIIVLLHEGGHQLPYDGSTKGNTDVEGEIKHIISQLDDGVDVVMGGHTHQFLNAYLTNRQGHQVLVTQANSYGASFAEVFLHLNLDDPHQNHASAKIITTYAQKAPNILPDPNVLKLVQYAEDKVNPIIHSSVGNLQQPLLREPNAYGESNLGNFIADAFRSMMHAEIGLTNPHGIRNDLLAGNISWGDIYSALPFSNHIVVVQLTGQDIYDLLEQQWMSTYENMLQISGIRYVYHPKSPTGQHVKIIYFNQQPLDRSKIYTVATTDFFASGHGVFSVMKRGKIIQFGGKDYEVVIDYIQQLPQPFSCQIDGRISTEFSSPSSRG